MSYATPTDALIKTISKIEGAYAPATIRAYKENFQKFIKFCVSKGDDALPAHPDSVRNFIEILSDGTLKSSSIRLGVAAISAIHRLNRLPDPTKDPEVALELRRTFRKLGRAQHQAYGINSDTLELMIHAASQSRNAKRDTALLLLAYDSLCRRSELVSINYEDVQFPENPEMLKIRLRKSKTDQNGLGRWLYISEITRLAVSEWILVSGIKSGPIFPSPTNKLKGSALGSDQISRIFKRLAAKSGLASNTVCQISGHSMRVGAAQDLLKSGASLPIIMNRGRWTKVDTVMRYVDQAANHMEPARLLG